MGPMTHPTALAPSFAPVGNRCHSLVTAEGRAVPQVLIECLSHLWRLTRADVEIMLLFAARFLLVGVWAI